MLSHIYAHLIKRGEEFTSISKAEAAALLKKDILRSEASVMKNIKVPLNSNQFDALVSFTFNVGGASLQRSSLRSKINSHADDNLIYHEFTRWVYATGRKSKGLIFRREIEANLFLK